MSRFLHAFNSAAARKPMITQCATSAVLFGTGDILAQQAFEKKGMNHDWMRTARLSFYGGAIFGPLLTKWLGLLNRLQFSTPNKAVMYKVYLDQFMFTPGVIALFFGANTLLEGKSVADAQERIADAYVPTIIRNWGVFIPTQIVNFKYVPPHLRFVTIGVVALFWNAYLSSVNAAKEREETAAHEHEHEVAIAKAV
ncbi:uncharacterized protein BXZ73DRAFT_44278 [Epithele typhae]|uniref:uncharacterized protein n=1 Tax=Epithele typhae TaxID=378194 RepID=UPI002008250D|nr:uncharacterized protein BXZ73DRAFT_44278 [Epithele typhae]KAH9939086.1 hypothetical protein BXZ73DRAFT_44278 [Epithele typhae]